MIYNKNLAKAIVKWMYHNEKLKQINSYLYNNTELFEQDKMSDYMEDLYAFFAAKITRFTKDHNDLAKKLPPDLKIQIELEKLFGGD